MDYIMVSSSSSWKEMKPGSLTPLCTLLKYTTRRGWWGGFCFSLGTTAVPELPQHLVSLIWVLGLFALMSLYCCWHFPVPSSVWWLCGGRLVLHCLHWNSITVRLCLYLFVCHSWNALLEVLTITKFSQRQWKYVGRIFSGSGAGCQSK